MKSGAWGVRIITGVNQRCNKDIQLLNVSYDQRVSCTETAQQSV